MDYHSTEDQRRSEEAAQILLHPLPISIEERREAEEPLAAEGRGDERVLGSLPLSWRISEEIREYK